MTTTRDTQWANTAGALLATSGFGTVVTWSITPTTGYDRTTGASTGTETSYSVSASPLLRVRQQYVDGETVRVTDSMVLVAAQGLAFTPAVGQRVTASGVSYRVIMVSPIQAQDDVVAYRAFVRGGP